MVELRSQFVSRHIKPSSLRKLFLILLMAFSPLAMSFDILESIIDEIQSCKYILSSSLYGIILSHTYNIPCVWINGINELGENQTKFYDYNSQVDRVNSDPNCRKLFELLTLQIYQIF